MTPTHSFLASPLKKGIIFIPHFDEEIDNSSKIPKGYNCHFLGGEGILGKLHDGGNGWTPISLEEYHSL